MAPHHAWASYPPPNDPTPHTVAGELRVLHALEGPGRGEFRDLYTYLPPSYHMGDRRYPVIYMQDGQNLFDEAASFAGEWRVDETMEALSRRGVEAIVVGVCNRSESRLYEYSPFPDARHGGGGGAAYAGFLARTIKPLVDRDFRTLPAPRHTSVAGSSMGGLISLFCWLRHPDVFGAAGVMSPALWFGGRAVFQWLARAPAVPGRIYLDVGTREGMRTVRDARRARDLLHRKGYDAGHDLLYVEEAGAAHEEAAWARRFRRAASFLLRADRAGQGSR